MECFRLVLSGFYRINLYKQQTNEQPQTWTFSLYLTPCRNEDSKNESSFLPSESTTFDFTNKNANESNFRYHLWVFEWDQMRIVDLDFRF